jgi:chromosome segregation ATPase
VPEELGFEDLLKKKKDELEQIKENIDEKTEEKNNLEGQIKDLDQKVSEVSQIVTAYRKEFNNINKDLQDLKDYYNNKMPLIEEAVKDKKEDIKNARKDFDNATLGITGIIKQLKIEYKNSSEKFKDSQVNFNNVKSEYEDLKNLQKEIEDDIKDISNLQNQIDKYDEVLDAEKRYFLILEINTVLNELEKKIIEPVILKSGLYTKLKNLDSERQDLDGKEKETKKAKNNYEQKQKSLELRTKNRRELIIQKISDP